MELIAADKDTVTIKMNRKEEFDPILAAFTAVNKDYGIADHLLHELTKEEIARLRLQLANIKLGFSSSGTNRTIHQQSSGIQMVVADQKTVTVKMLQIKEFMAVFGVFGALAVRYDLTGQETDPAISNLTAGSVFTIEESLGGILDSLNRKYNDKIL
ncbi:MAG: hypothetical protein IPP67_04630 [Rhodospirillaceae bacterium]|nr:hypothetical protein [Rhodospirillaceae bacterium]